MRRRASGEDAPVPDLGKTLGASHGFAAHTGRRLSISPHPPAVPDRAIAVRRHAPAHAGKFDPPGANAALVRRAAVAERIARGAAARLVLVRAPAGFGKTTALRQIHEQLQERGVATAWITLDAGEGFPLSGLVPPDFLENRQKLAYISDRRKTMTRLTEQILAHATGLPEGAPVSAKGLLHLGNRAAVDQALSRLSERGQLIRAGRGVYLRPSPAGSARAHLRSSRLSRPLRPKKGRSSSRTAPPRRTLLA